MTNNQISNADKALWQHLVQTEQAFRAAQIELFDKASSVVELVRAALRGPEERPLALRMAGLLKPL